MADLSLRYLLFGEDRTATSTINKVGGAFTKMGSAIGGEFGEILDKVGEGIDHIGEHAHSAGAKLTAAGGVVTGIGAALQFIGSADKQAADQLKQAVEASGHSYEQYAEDVEKAVKHQENFGHSAVDTQTALRNLTQATNDPKKALEQMGLVANLAAAKHISLADASGLVAKIIGGKGSRTLAEYGITMDNATASANRLRTAETQHQAALDRLARAQRSLTDIEMVDGQRKKLTIGQQIQLRNAHEAVASAQANLKVKTQQLASAQEHQTTQSKASKDALEQLAHKTDGQASASVNNFGAKVNIVKTKLEDWTAAMGQKLGPALTAIGPGLMVVGSLMEIMRARQLAAAAATEAETVAQGESKLAMVAGAVATGVMTVATGAWAAAQWVLNAALDANPITLVIIGIVALVAAVIMAYRHSQTFQRIVHAAFHAVGVAFEWAWGKIKAGFHWLESHWKLILSIMTGPIGAAVIYIASHWDQIVGFIKKLPGRIGSAASGMWDGIKNAFKAAINWIIDGWNSLHFGIPTIDTHIPGIGKVGGGSFGVPRIHPLAMGGIVSRPTLALIGEAGPEAVVPLNRGNLSRIGSGTEHIHVHVTMDGREVRTSQKRTTRLLGGVA